MREAPGWANSTATGSMPLVSVVVPTRNRAKTLRYCLKTITDQTYPRIQIVVSDNHSEDDTRDVVASMDDERIIYVRADRPLSMNDSYNFALEAAKGDFVTYIGDDDGLLPNAVAVAMRLLADGRYGALTWRKIEYHWPDHKVSAVSNVMHGNSEPVLLEVDGARKLKLFAEFKETYNTLPCVYNSIVSMSAIKKVRSGCPDGRFFGGIIPDVHSGIALGPFIGTYLQAKFPLTVNGASSMSSGVIQGLTERTEQEEELIRDISQNAFKMGYDPDIGQSPSVYSIVHGEFLVARSRNPGAAWPAPHWRSYVKALIREAKQSPNQEAILESARFTARRRRIAIRVPPPRKASTTSPETTSFQGRMVLPTDLVADVYQVSKLVGSLLPCEPRIQRSVPSYFFRKWLEVNFRMAIDFYRALRSRAA